MSHLDANILFPLPLERPRAMSTAGRFDVDFACGLAPDSIQQIQRHHDEWERDYAFEDDLLAEHELTDCEASVLNSRRFVELRAGEQYYTGDVYVGPARSAMSSRNFLLDSYREAVEISRSSDRFARHQSARRLRNIVKSLLKRAQEQWRRRHCDHAFAVEVLGQTDCPHCGEHVR